MTIYYNNVEVTCSPLPTTIFEPVSRQPISCTKTICDGVTSLRIPFKFYHDFVVIIQNKQLELYHKNHNCALLNALRKDLYDFNIHAIDNVCFESNSGSLFNVCSISFDYKSLLSPAKYLLYLSRHFDSSTPNIRDAHYRISILKSTNNSAYSALDSVYFSLKGTPQ